MPSAKKRIFYLRWSTETGHRALGVCPAHGQPFHISEVKGLTLYIANGRTAVVVRKEGEWKSQCGPLYKGHTVLYVLSSGLPQFACQHKPVVVSLSSSKILRIETFFHHLHRSGPKPSHGGFTKASCAMPWMPWMPSWLRANWRIEWLPWTGGESFAPDFSNCKLRLKKLSFRGDSIICVLELLSR